MNGGVLIMKKYLKEILILLIQLFMFYVFPLFAGVLPASLCAKIMVFRRITRIIEVVLNERAVRYLCFLKYFILNNR